ncbi:MAG: GntG family PLP-dependent aldolase [Xanthomonadales bacterium]|nr:GntG family PLP-dependent aldolase [Xanthomonadales bacterium]
MNEIIDLRSDTFTLPSEGMRRVICEAQVGNSGYGEDPSVNRLEEEVAEWFGQEAAVFLPSATMAGQIAIAVWCRPGDIVVIEEYGHNYYFETGAMAAIAGAQASLLTGERGILQPAAIEAAVDGLSSVGARASLVVLENTSNFGGGTIYPQATLDRIFALTRERKLPVHVDGARVWNAIVASGSDPAAGIQPDGSISVCFSKGLGAPMGALLLGPADFIKEARHLQFMLGGVMRQVGFMAAAALYGFRQQLERLAEDHANAALLAERLAGNPALEIDRAAVQTNIVYATVKAGAGRAARLVSELDQQGVKALAIGPRLRFVTCLDISREDCIRAAERINGILEH